MEDVVAQRIVLGLDLLEAVLEIVELADLQLQLLNVSFFSLTESSL